MAALMGTHTLWPGLLSHTSAACCMDALILFYVLEVMACYASKCDLSLTY